MQTICTSHPLFNTDFTRDLFTFIQDKLGITQEQVQRPDGVPGARSQEYVCVRSCLSCVLLNNGWSSPKIGKLLGGRDHSSILHLKEKCEERVGRYKDYTTTYNLLSSYVESINRNAVLTVGEESNSSTELTGTDSSNQPAVRLTVPAE